MTGIWTGDQKLEPGPTEAGVDAAVTYTGSWTYRLTTPHGGNAYVWLTTTTTYQYRQLAANLELTGWQASSQVVPGLGDRLPALSTAPMQAHNDLRPAGQSRPALRSVRKALATTLETAQAEVSFTRSSGPASSPPIR